MSSGSSALSRLAAVVVLCLFAVGCGSGDDDTAAETTIEGTDATEAPTTEAPTTTVAEEPTTTASTVDPNAPIPYEGTGGSLSAAGITWTASQCAFPDGERIGADAPDHFSSVAVVGAGVFLTGQDGEEDEGLMKYTFDGAEGCTLTADTSFGTGGVLELDDGVEYVTAADNGQVLASDTIFETWLVDAETGASVACGTGDRVDISPDGAVAWGHFPGSAEINLYELGDGTCTVTDDAVSLTTQDNPTAGGWIDDDTYLIGGFNDDGSSVTRLDRAGNETWRTGGSRIDTDTGYGVVTDVAPCGAYICVLDSNFRDVHILEPADGTQIGLLDLQELVGLDILWFNKITEADDGALWVVGGLAQELPDGESSEQVQGLVYRIELN